MLGAVEDTSFGLLSVTARDKDGSPIDMNHLEDYIVHDREGNEVKEWYAIASYLQAMGGEVNSAYSQTDGRKVAYASWNPVDLLKHPNKFTWIALGVLLALILIVVLVVRLVVRRLGRRGGRKSAKGYSPYRGR